MDIDEAQEGIKMAFTHFLDNRKSALQQMHENALDYWKPLYDALHFERIYTGKIFSHQIKESARNPWTVCLACCGCGP